MLCIPIGLMYRPVETRPIIDKKQTALEDNKKLNELKNDQLSINTLNDSNRSILYLITEHSSNLLKFISFYVFNLWCLNANF